MPRYHGILIIRFKGGEGHQPIIIGQRVLTELFQCSLISAEKVQKKNKSTAFRLMKRTSNVPVLTAPNSMGGGLCVCVCICVCVCVCVCVVGSTQLGISRC